MTKLSTRIVPGDFNSFHQTIIGPLCVMAMIAIYRNSPSRHLYQLIISVFHIFSCSLYYILDSFKGFSSCDPDPIYFWVYFVGFNSPWIIVCVSNHGLHLFVLCIRYSSKSPIIRFPHCSSMTAASAFIKLQHAIESDGSVQSKTIRQ